MSLVNQIQSYCVYSRCRLGAIPIRRSSDRRRQPFARHPHAEAASHKRFPEALPVSLAERETPNPALNRPKFLSNFGLKFKILVTGTHLPPFRKYFSRRLILPLESLPKVAEGTIGQVLPNIRHQTKIEMAVVQRDHP